MSDEIRFLPVAKILDPENPMRSALARDGIFELSESIKREGLINPITVRPVGDSFHVVAGHRRLVACRLAGLSEIACVVRDLSDAQAWEVMAHENLERQDVDPVDEALFLGRLIGEDESRIPEIAEKLNRSTAWVRDRLEILSYPDYMLAPIKEGTLKLGVASWLGLITDDFWRKQYVDSAVGQGMSVLQARYLHDQWKMGVTPSSDVILPLQEELSSGEPVRARAQCAACGQMAVDPNLRNVFVHRECPSVDVSSGGG